MTPDPYRGLRGRDDAEAGRKYAADVKSLIDYATAGRVAAFIAESIQGVGGCVVALIALVIAVLPNLPGFLVNVKLLDADTVPPFFVALYSYAWFVGFGIAFVVYVILRLIGRL